MRVRTPRPPAAGALILAAGYKRCSSKEQAEGYGLDVQDDALRDWESAGPNRRLVGMFSDEGVSGALDNRPEMMRLEEYAYSGRINRIAVHKVDRVGRTARAAYNWAWRMKDVGVHFIAIQEQIDTSTDIGWTMFQQYVFFSEMEWNRIRERTQAGREKKLSYGGWPGGPPPYGFRIDGIGQRGSRLVISEDETRVLLKAVDLVMSERMSIPDVAGELNGLGLLTRSGKPWTSVNLYHRLHSETLLEGYTTYRKTNRGDRKNSTKLYEDGTPVYGEPVRLAVPPILTPDRRELLKEILGLTAFRRKRSKNRVYPLSGRIIGGCGKGLVGGGRALEVSYRCSGKSCGDGYLPAEPLEEAVWGEVCKLLTNRERLEALAQGWVESLPGDVEKYRKRQERLTRDIEKQRSLIDRSVPEYIRAGMNPAIAAAAVATLEEELNRLVLQQEEVNHWLAAHEETRIRVESLAGLARLAQGRLREMPLDGQAEILEMLNIRGTLEPGHRKRSGGNACAVATWHRETGTLVPPEVTAEQWPEIERLLLERHGKLHFSKSRIDLRQALNGILHRLRLGLSWSEMPGDYGPPERIRERQLTWWSRGTWPVLMEHLGARERGTPVPVRPVIPRLHLTGEVRSGLFVALEAGDSSPPTGNPPDAPTGTGLESPIQRGASLRFELTSV